MNEIYPLSGYQVLPGHGIRINTSNPDKPMFVARDVTMALGYKNGPDAVKKHCRHTEKLTIAKRDGQRGGAQFLTFIPEGDVYRLIVRSKLPAAEQFERKVFDEILPQIRKTGNYIAAPVPATPLEQLRLQVEALEAIEKRQTETDSRVEAIEHKIKTNGCEPGYLPMDKAHRAYGYALSLAMFKAVIDSYQIPTKQYSYTVPESDGEIAWGTSVLEEAWEVVA